MRRHLAIPLVALALATSASAQSSWTGDHFTVATDNAVNLSVTGGTVTVQDVPYLLGLSNAGANLDQGTAQFDLELAALPGYVLLGEQVSFQLFVQVGGIDVPASVFVPAGANVSIDVNGVQVLSQAFGAGSATLTPGVFLADPNLVARVGASTQEGLACPVGHEADGCGFGGYWRFQDALVELSGITVTPLLAAVPEPAPAAPLLAGLAILARTRRRARLQAQSAQTICPPADVHLSNPAA